MRADVFHHLRADQSRYGLIVLDPPKFARREGEVADAARGYHDINRLALERLAPGGHLLTFSCSQAVNLILFQQIVFEAAKEAQAGTAGARPTRRRRRSSIQRLPPRRGIPEGAVAETGGMTPTESRRRTRCQPAATCALKASIWRSHSSATA